MTTERYIPEDFNVLEQHRRAIFMEHMYKCSGRENPEHPQHGHFTGLWQKFCIEEAGPVCVNMWFDQQHAIAQYKEEMRKLEVEKELPEISVALLDVSSCSDDECSETFIPTYSD